MKKIALLPIFLILIFSLLVSCRTRIKTNGQDEAIFGVGVKTRIIISAEGVDENIGALALEIKSHIDSVTGEFSELRNDESDESSQEIVIGNTTRKITESAKRSMNTAVKAAMQKSEYLDEQILAFTIYSDGRSVAIVYNDDRVFERALLYFIDNYFGGNKLILEDGYSRTETMTLLEYFEEIDEERDAREWSEVEELLGTEVKVALEEFYGMYDERFYLWLADLYDPVTGGFYCTNAARDTQDYLPDIQSTAQVLAFLNNSGMTKNHGGWEYALPSKITDSISEFVKGLQSSQDGYFYHPQWEGLQYTASRLGRDVTWASEILQPLYKLYESKYKAEGYTEQEMAELLEKYMPYWDTPGGLKGSKGKPGLSSVSYEYLTGRLNNMSKKSAVAAVSSVVSTSSWTDQLQSLACWRAYLYGGTVDGKTFAGLDLAGDSYTVGNTLSAQVSQIKQRDAEAKGNGEISGYVELTRKFLDDGVNSHNGLWEDEVKYNSVNGLMKIVSVYNAMQWELLYPSKAMESAIAVARLTEPDLDGKEPIAAVDVYNPWVCISGIFTNVSTYNNTLNRSEFESTWRTYVQKSAVDMIKGTAKKIAKFSKDDGSYGYHWGAPPVNAQGMPVTVSGVVCGDVDGACLSSTGTITRMCDALGLSTVPALFGAKDMEIFSRRLMGHGSIIKDSEEDTEVFVYDFEDGAIGKEYHYAGGTIGTGERVVAGNNLNDPSNKLMLSITDPDSVKGYSTTFQSLGLASNKANCYILEFDIYLEDVKKGSYIEIKLGSSSNAAYMLTLIGKDDGSASIGDHSGSPGGISKSFGKSIPAKEWHTIRVEYYCGEPSEIVIKNYLDGELIYNSDNFFGKRSGIQVEHDPIYDKASFYSTYDSTVKFCIDNITVEKAKKKYVDEAVYNPNRVKDFENGEIPTGVKAPDSSVSADPSGTTNSMLKASGTVTVNTTEHLTPANVYVLESDIYVQSSRDGDVATVYMTSGIASEAVYALTLTSASFDDERVIKLHIATREGVIDEVVGVAPMGETFKLRIEYYRYQYNENYTKVQSIVYINGTESGRSETGYYVYNVARNYNKLIVKITDGATVYLDNLIAETDKIAFRDVNGKTIPDPKNPIFPSGGAGGAAAPDEGYNGHIDFEGTSLGVPTIPGLTTKPNSNEFGNDIEVADDPTGEDNKALLFSTVSSANAGNRAQIIPYEVSADSNCYVFEWDMYIKEGSVPYYQFKLGDCFTLELRGNTTLRILTKSVNPTDGSGRIEALLGGKPHSLTMNEWHNLRIEYYPGTAETVKILVYVDGAMYETTHFYGKGTNVVGTPTNSYDAETPVTIYSAYDSSADVYFDNIIAEKIVKDYPIIDNEDPDDPNEGGGAGENTGDADGSDDNDDNEKEPGSSDDGGSIIIPPGYISPEGAPLPDDFNPNWSTP